MKLVLYPILIVISLNLTAQITRDEAIEFVVTEFVGSDSLTYYHLYARYDKMFINDTLWLEGFNDYYICPFEENWVFFVDDVPNAFWAHPCRFIFINVNNADCEVVEDSWPPTPFLINYTDFLLEWEWILSTHVDPNKTIYKEECIILAANPFQDHVEVKIQSDSNDQLNFQLFNSSGHILISEVKNNPRGNEKLLKLNTANLKAGVYYLIVSKGGQLLVSKKLIKAY